MKTVNQLEKILLSANRSVNSLYKAIDSARSARVAKHAIKDLPKLTNNVLNIESILNNSIESVVDETKPLVLEFLSKKFDLFPGSEVRLDATEIHPFQNIAIKGEFVGAQLNTKGSRFPSILLKIGNPQYSYEREGKLYDGVWERGGLYCATFKESHPLNGAPIEVVEIPLFIKDRDLEFTHISYNFNIF